MAGNITNYLENALLGHALGLTTFTKPTSTFLALYTTSPTDSSAGVEVTGGAYARQAIVWAAVSNGASSNSNTITFPTATALWGSIVAVAVVDAATSGNILLYGPMTTARTIAIGDFLTFAAAALQASLD